MDPILRRSAFYYLTTFSIYTGALGQHLTDDPWPSFHVIPLFMPAYLLTAIVVSEKDEAYAFLRTLPVADSRIVRTKFGLIFASALLYWLFMTIAALARADEGVTDTSTLIYVTLVCGTTLLLGLCWQISIWRFGYAWPTGVAAVFIGLSVILALVHTVGLKRNPDWPLVTSLGSITWLAATPWVSNAAFAAVFLAAAYWLLRVGVRVKERSEA